MRRVDNAGTAHFTYVDGNPLASTNAAGNFDNDYNYTPVNERYPGASPGSYVVSSGDTLRSIALAVYGDARLWFLIAQGNGLASDADLRAGQTLNVPNRVTNLYASAETVRPYSPGEIVGDTTPTLPDPPPPPPPPRGKGCGGFGQFLTAVVTIAVSVMLGPAVGNIAGQIMGNITGVQRGFNFRSFAIAVVTPGIMQGAGITDAINGLGADAWMTKAITAAASSVVGQGVAIVVGAQKRFEWRAVAAAAIGGAAGHAFGTAFGAAGENFARSVVTQAVANRGRVNFVSVAADVFGNMLGSAMREQMLMAAREQQLMAAREQRLAAREDARDAAMWQAVGGGAASQQAPSVDRPAATAANYAAADVSSEDDAGRIDGSENEPEGPASPDSPGWVSSGDLPSSRTIRVRAGQTLSQVMHTNDVRVLDRIAQLNGLRSRHEVRAGQELVLPESDMLANVVVSDAVASRGAGLAKHYAQVAAVNAANARAAAQQASQDNAGTVTISGIVSLSDGPGEPTSALVSSPAPRRGTLRLSSAGADGSGPAFYSPATIAQRPASSADSLRSYLEFASGGVLLSEAIGPQSLPGNAYSVSSAAGALAGSVANAQSLVRGSFVTGEITNGRVSAMRGLGSGWVAITTYDVPPQNGAAVIVSYASDLPSPSRMELVRAAYNRIIVPGLGAGLGAAGTVIDYTLHRAAGAEFAKNAQKATSQDFWVDMALDVKKGILSASAGAAAGAAIGAGAGTVIVPILGTAVGSVGGAIIGFGAGLATGYFVSTGIEKALEVTNTRSSWKNRQPLNK